MIAAANDGQKGAFTVTSFVPNTFSVASIVNKYKPNPLNLRATGVPEPIRKICSKMSNYHLINA